MTRVLITGVSGFCGKHLAALLSTEKDYCVAGADVAISAPENLSLYSYSQMDVSESSGTSQMIQTLQPEMIFHLAGTSGGSSKSAVDSPPLRAFEVNTSGTLHILDSVRRHMPECRVLVAGSAAEYGRISETDLPVTEDHVCHPEGAYGVSKFAATLAAQEYARAFGLKVVVARPFNIIGPGMPRDLVIGAIAHRAKEALAASEDPVVKTGDLSSKRDFVAVEDVVRAYVALLKADAWGEVFNICSGQAHSIREAAEMLVSHSPRPIRFETDSSLARSSASCVYGSFEKARKAIGYHPTISLESSLAAIWNAAMSS